MFNFQHIKMIFHDIPLNPYYQNYLNYYILNYRLKKILLNRNLIRMELILSNVTN